MNNNPIFDAIVVGGSSAGLSASLALGRARRKVLLIDSGLPCNRMAPHSHNFFTRDGTPPLELLSTARDQLKLYKTIESVEDLVTGVEKTKEGFDVKAESGKTWSTKKMVFATGIKDIMPPIPGFIEAWGISIIHCPYCHGYEYRDQKTGILAAGKSAYEMGKLISNWTGDLTIYTNGEEELSEDYSRAITKKGIKIVDRKIKELVQENGKLKAVLFEDDSSAELSVLYAHPEFEQHCKLPIDLGCELTEQGHIKVDMMTKTSVEGVFACGDNSSFIRSIASAVFAGSMAGGSLNAELINEVFE
ncbi:NAD(P)/FAD-dependent oxidoreductase [Chryseobacterium sp. A321]